MRVPFEELHDTLRRALVIAGLEPDRASLSARLFAEASRDGVSSHGLNRFPRFMRGIASGVVNVRARATRTAAHGALERWDGGGGPGNLNAHDAMTAAIDLARAHGIGCVALRHTNHWMRGGSYGWQAADAGMIGVCWTNTLANVPPWGATTPLVGNNPLVVAVPRSAGHVVLDMAMSQFSVGALASYRSRGESLPVAGGYDADGNLTRDPGAIEASRRLLPIGFWKGSGLAIALDLVAAMLSGGLATHDIPVEPDRETNLSQVFIAIDPATMAPAAERDRVADALIAHLHGGDGTVRYPGERTLETRARSLRDGVVVDPDIWRGVQSGNFKGIG
jgi:3-dehydro-L-gulonate 2-dehydrogenase